MQLHSTRSPWRSGRSIHAFLGTPSPVPPAGLPSARRAAWFACLGLVAVACTSSTDPSGPLGDFAPGVAESEESGGVDEVGPDADTGATESGSMNGLDEGVEADADASGDGMMSGGSDGACIELEYAWTPVRAQLLFLLDYSGSMSTAFEDPDGLPGTRWSVLHDLVSVLAADHADRFEFGAKLFPWPEVPAGTPNSSCAVSGELEAPLGSDGPQLLAALPAADALPWGETPMGSATAVAGDALLGADPTRPRALVLIADGGASIGCGPNEDYPTMADRFATWREDGISTFVVGIGVGSTVAEDFESLTGGAPVYTPTDAFGLHAALETIAAATASCTVSLDANPVSTELIARLDEEFLESSGSCMTRGYVYDEAEGTVRLCASACDDYLAGAELRVETPCHAD